MTVLSFSQANTSSELRSESIKIAWIYEHSKTIVVNAIQNLQKQFSTTKRDIQVCVRVHVQVRVRVLSMSGFSTYLSVTQGGRSYRVTAPKVASHSGS